jgi:hypothetical protein
MRTMSPKTWMLDTIEVNVSGFFITHHYLQTKEGMVGEFSFPAFGQRGVYHAADGRELLMQKAHWLDSAHELVEGQVVRGTARRSGLLRRAITIQLDGQEYVLEPQGIFNQGWRLVDAQGNTLLEIGPRGVFGRDTYLAPTGVLEADLIAFSYYVYYMNRQEETAAAVAAS